MHFGKFFFIGKVFKVLVRVVEFCDFDGLVDACCVLVKAHGACKAHFSVHEDADGECFVFALACEVCFFFLEDEGGGIGFRII